MDYKQAEAMLNGRSSKKIANNTYLLQLEDNKIALKLHETNIIIFQPEFVELFSGGWRTVTTKARLNKFAPVQVDQRNSIWYIGDKLFQEGVKVDFRGNVISKTVSTTKVEEANKKIKAKIKKYATLVDKLTKDQMIPSNGDCWYCAFRDQEKKETLGDLTENKDHLNQHFKDNYIFGSIIVNSLIEAGYQSPQVIIAMEVKDSIKRSLTKYLQKRLLVQI